MRTWQYLLIGGLCGVASLGLAPFEKLAPISLPAEAARALVLVQPAILTLLAIGVGTALAPKIGLGAPLIEAWRTRAPIGPVFRRQAPPALVIGLCVAVLLQLYGANVVPAIRAAAAAGSAGVSGFELPLATRLLYGGITEELLTRWGLMSFFAWALWRVRRRPTLLEPWGYWLAIGAAALVFAAGHLPLLLLLVAEPPSWIIVAVIAGNAAPGIAFGWLFWRRGIEAAMLAHMLAHLFAALLVLLLA